LGIVALEFLVIVAWVLARGRQINMNAALLLDCGQKIYRGQLPYADFYEFNPPVIMYLSALPAWFSAISGMHICLAFQMFVLACIGAGTGLILLACRLMGLHPADTLRVISTAMLFHFLLLYFEVFGEREHLLVILITPFLIVRSADFKRPVQSPSEITGLFTCGLLAGVGASIKPYYMVIPFLVELRRLVTTQRFSRGWSPETAGFMVALLAYVASWFVVPGPVRQSYFQLLLPLAMSGYDAYSNGLQTFLWNFLPNHPTQALFNDICLMILGLTLYRLAASRSMNVASDGASRLREISLGMLCAWLGALVCFVCQKKGWFYHLAPLDWFAMLAWAFQDGSRRETACGEMQMQSGPGRLAFGPLLLMVVLFGYNQARPMLRYVRPNFSANLARYIAEHEKGNGQVIVMASSVRAYPAVLMAGRTGGSRFLDFFHLPSLYFDRKYKDQTGPEIYRAGATDAALEKRFLQELYDDIARRGPGLILINTSDGDTGLPRRFNIRDYYHFHGIAELLQKDYKSLENFTPGIAREPTFEVWTRKSGPE